jgi:hypothetical protein
LETEAREKDEWDDDEEIHEGTGGRDQDFIAAAGGVGPSDVSAAQFQSKLAHRNFESRSRKDVTCLVEQKAQKKQSGFRNAELPSTHADAEDDADKDQEPASAMHAERDSQSRHGGHPFPLALRKR